MFKAAVIGDPVRISWSNREKRCAWTTAERCGFLGCRHSSDSIIPRSVVGLPFDSQQLSRTPLVESINLVYISPSNCPKVPSTRIRAAYTTSDWWKLRFLTSRSDCIRHVLQESIFEWLSAVLLTRPEDIRPRPQVIQRDQGS